MHRSAHAYFWTSIADMPESIAAEHIELLGSELAPAARAIGGATGRSRTQLYSMLVEKVGEGRSKTQPSACGLSGTDLTVGRAISNITDDYPANGRSR
jgi:hypothetical protein